MKDQAVIYSPGANDEVFTPAYAVKALLPHLQLPKGATIWCPFDKPDSHFVVQLFRAGFEVVFSHIHSGQDFYAYQPPVWDAMVSNPPFTNKAAIFQRAMNLGKPFALLMSLTWLNDAAPKRILGNELQLLMFEERVKYIGQGAKITFSSAYFGRNIFQRPIQCDSLKNYGMASKSGQSKPECKHKFWVTKNGRRNCEDCGHFIGMNPSWESM